MSNSVMSEAERRAQARMNGDSGLITHEERERRLLFIAEKMVDGMSRRLLVEMSMTCFCVGRRAAQKYVAAAERRLHNRGAHLSPLFCFELSRTQRDKLLESLFHHTHGPEELDPKVLVEVVNAANRVLDSRDRATALLFQMRDAAGRGPTRVNLQVNSIHTEAGMLRAQEDQPRLPTTADNANGRIPAPDSEEEVPPEIMARLKQKVAEGCTVEEAVDLVFAEVHGRPAPKMPVCNNLQRDSQHGR